MNDRSTKDPERPSEVELLLPWHVVERLEAEEAERVEAALAADPELARRLDLAREERAETVAVNQALGLPSVAAREALFARIAADEGGRARKTSLGRHFSQWLASLSPRSLAWSAMAAGLVIALQAGFLAASYVGGGEARFETASHGGTAPAEAGSIALVAFAPDATAAQIAELLRETRATIVDGPRPGGIFRVRVSDRPLATTDLGIVLDRLRGQGAVVRFAVPEPAKPVP